MFATLSTLATVCTLALVVVISNVIGKRTRNKPLPPGPKPIWPIGNLHQIPWGNSTAEVYGQWGKIYGPLVYFRTFGREFVVINTLKAALDLFEKRSHLYATKPRLVMAGELVGKDKSSLVFFKYNSLWKDCRRITHSWMAKPSIQGSGPSLELNADKLLLTFLETPQEFAQYIRSYTATALLSVLYGIECSTKDDPLIKLSERVSLLTSEAMRPGRWLCDSFPWMAYVPSWFPGGYFKCWAMEARRASDDLLHIPYERVKASVIEGRAKKSWVADSMLDETGQLIDGEDSHTLMISAGSLYAAGIDTTASALRTFLLVMTRHPEIQKKAQEEIDSVVGKDRLPTLSDRDSLPYVECVIKEVLRFAAVAALMPHSLDEDDIYNGYTIPKGAWVMVNAWSIFYDPALYPEPREFRPERFLSTGDHEAETDPYTVAFGFGRRACAGTPFVQAWLFLNMARVLSVFNISPVTGKGIPPANFVMRHIRIPAEFECSMVPRSTEKVKLLHHDVLAAP
ncbi:hypothetical protein PTI98_012736 [Pleurotus ostreatus]|nr:hypothetical protein PTI98_012736 [Pleurotus ostreatus]